MGNTNSVYVAKRASSLANPITTQVTFKQADNSSYAAFARFPITAEGSNFTSALFRIRARGRATTGGSLTFKAAIQLATDVSNPAGWTSAATSTNNTDLIALSARTIATATRSWYIDALVTWDSTSQRLTGQANGLNSETIETASAAISALTSVDLTTGKNGVVVAALFGTTNAANVAYLDELVVEAL